MIFQWTYKQVLDGSKTQTRRLWKTGEYAAPGGFLRESAGAVMVELPRGDREKWRRGNTYAVQPGRGKKAVGRIRITKIIRKKLQDITEEDAIAEGMFPTYRVTPYLGTNEGVMHTPRDQFARLWDSIHTKPGTRWRDNPLVWVLTFELVEDGND